MRPDGEPDPDSLLAEARMRLEALEAATPAQSKHAIVDSVTQAELHHVLGLLRRYEQLVGGRAPDASRVAPPRPTTSLMDATPDASRPPMDEMMAGVWRQAQRMDLDMERLARSYAGQYVVYHDGDVLGHGETIDEALGPLDDSQRALPLVLRYVDVDREEDFMGGPKEG